MKLHPYQQKSLIRGGIVVLAILLPVAGFFGGVAYQKGKTPTQTTASSTAGTNANGMRRFNRAGFNMGQVTAVSATSITITLRSDNSSKTFTIDSKTQVRNAQSTGSASDIKTGDQVVVEQDSSNATVAARILLNPMFPSMGGNPAANTN